MIFNNRQQAGQALAKQFKRIKFPKNSIVLGLPRGGVPVAYEIAIELHLPLDIFIVRKLGVPGYEELAMGAIAEGDVIFLNQEIIQSCSVPEDLVQQSIASEMQELQRRSQLYRGGHSLSDLKKKTVILVDDGIATGASLRTAIKALQQQEVTKIIVAIPVAPKSAIMLLQQEVDQIICVATPDNFMSVGQFYNEFHQLSDEEVIRYLQAQP